MQCTFSAEIICSKTCLLGDSAVGWADRSFSVCATAGFSFHSGKVKKTIDDILNSF